MSNIPCTVQADPPCQDCSIADRLMCRYDGRDTLHFFMLLMPFFVTTIPGVIVAGYGAYLYGWLAYALFFFFFWEARVLCSHCPYWAEDSLVLHCHANYGVVKLWKFHPAPMSRFEQIQFFIGALIFLIYPLVFLFLGGRILLATIAIVSAVSATYLLRRNVCVRCVNFSCPMNAVPQKTAQEYLRLNPQMRQAWEKSGYPPDDPQ